VWNTLLYQPLLNLLIIFYNLLGHNMGVAIIALTILARLILLPFTMKSLLAQKKIKDMQPEMERIKKDHGHDKQKLTKATMELYQKHGINPLSSCLPLIIQLPIFIALYRVFFKLTQSSQLNMLYPFVVKPENIQTHFLWFDLAKPDPFYILPILAGATLFWQTKMVTPKQMPEEPENGKGQQMEQFQKMLSKQMMYLFPVMTVFIALKFPSALALYWVVTTLFGIVQQYIVFKGDKSPGVIQEKGTKGTIVTVKKRE